MPRRSHAFTLIELLVVLIIIGIATGLVIGTTGKRDARREAVLGAAEELAATLRLTRAKAMERRSVMAVAFNIENAPGSSGRVLNNRSGGHWYRILGPAGAGSGGQYNSIPILRDLNYYRPIWPNFTNYLMEVDRDWISDRRTLPKGKVRFLALSDTDEGGRQSVTIPGWLRPEGQVDASAYPATYPRPWFGVYDPASKRLHAWGGYDPDDADPARRRTAGFGYEGNDGRIDGCVNPSDRVFDHYIDSNGDGAVDATAAVPAATTYTVGGAWDYTAWVAAGRPEHTRWTLLQKGAPRPLVNAAWMDAAIAFTPEGRAVSLAWQQGRWSYANANVVTGGRTDWPWGFATVAAGAKDMVKPRHDWYSPDMQDGPVANFPTYTGGWYITLGPDAPDDEDRFPTVREAMASISPAVRVFVSAHGDVRVVPVRMLDDGVLAGRTLFPAAASDWQVLSTLDDNISWGVLHPYRPATTWQRTWLRKPGSGTLPSGAPREAAPISDLVTPQMLIRQQWWYDE